MNKLTGFEKDTGMYEVEYIDINGSNRRVRVPAFDKERAKMVVKVDTGFLCYKVISVHTIRRP
jgi:hypothetical protein